ncbi:hypothetical protein [Echinicola rosea]|uniref:hypothetical protein n=1 Tax=Echinicola rosea TaxID=1807691 RepID=UPI001E4D6E44|nr:hypothetical protein [Echinicola rosea]
MLKLNNQKLLNILVIVAVFTLISCSSNKSSDTDETVQVKNEQQPYSTWMADSEIK